MEDDQRVRSILERILACRWGTFEDLKEPDVFLASEANRYVSGEMMVIDGGWMSR